MDINIFLGIDSDRSIKTVEQLQQIINWVRAGQMPLSHFVLIVGQDLQLFDERDRAYVATCGQPSRETIARIIEIIETWQVLDCSGICQ